MCTSVPGVSDYYAIVMHIQNDYQPQYLTIEWQMSYFLYGAFGTEADAHSYVSHLPPVDEGGVHRLGLAVTPKPLGHNSAEGSGLKYVIVLRDFHGKSTAPSLIPMLWGPFQPQEADDFAASHTGANQEWCDVGMVLQLQRPT